MIFTAQDAITFMKKHLGKCNTSSQLARINEATQHLMYEADWKLMIRRVRVRHCKNIITLPPQFDKVLALTADAAVGMVHSPYWEFLEGGPGRIDGLTDTWSKDLVDHGRRPTFYDIGEDKARYLIALSADSSDAGKTITLRGIDEDNHEILTSGIPGATLTINQWTGGTAGAITNISGFSISAQTWKRIDYIEKPTTKGYVTLYAYDPDAMSAANAALDADEQDPVLTYLGTYHPDDTQPSLRRYKILNHSCCCGDYLVLLVRLAYVPMIHLNDVLLIQNLPALKAMCQALNKYDAEELDLANGFQAQAIMLLKKQQNKEEQVTNDINIQGGGWSLGSVKGVI